MVLLGTALIVLGWSGNWLESRQSDAGLHRGGRVWIELIDSGQARKLLSFPQPPTPAEIFKAAGLRCSFVFPSGLRIPDRTRVVVNRSSGQVQWSFLGEGLSFSLGRKMNLNRASVRDLALLPGVGPATARMIFFDRTANGPFTVVDDLSRVKGIGPQKIEILQSLVYASWADAGKDPDTSNPKLWLEPLSLF